MSHTGSVVFAANGRTVQAMDRATGRPAWQFKLPRTFSGGFVTMICGGDELYVARGSYVYCLDARTGQVLWERGVGTSWTGGPTMLALPGVASGDVAAMAHAQQAASSAAAAAAGAAASSAAAAG